MEGHNYCCKISTYSHRFLKYPGKSLLPLRLHCLYVFVKRLFLIRKIFFLVICTCFIISTIPLVFLHFYFPYIYNVVQKLFARFWLRQIIPACFIISTIPHQYLIMAAKKFVLLHMVFANYSCMNLSVIAAVMLKK